MAFERIRTRRDTTAAWAMTNPVLGLGELGIDVTLQKVKAGDGLRPWNELPFLSETEIVNTLDSARTDAALSAAQGKVLNQALGAVTQNLNGLQGAVAGKLNKGDVLNTLDSDRTDAALSATQGKVLNTRKQDKAPEEITINIAANGNDSTGDGSAGKPYKTLPKAVNVLGGMVGQTIATINIGPGTYEMNGLFFHRIQIAKIKVQAANPEKKPVLCLLDGYPLGIFNYHGVKFIDCYNLCFKRFPTSTGESLVASGYTGCIGFSGCEFIGNMKTGLYVEFGSTARIAGCTFKLCDIAVSVVEGSSAYISGCATEQSTVNKALFCRGASAFVVSSPEFKGKIANVEKNNGLVIGL